MELADKKCIACESGIGGLSEEDTVKMLRQTPRWQSAGNRIERTFSFSNFVQAMDFANLVARIAEEENHHPDLHISWGKVRVDLSTHSVNGLTENDFIMAAKIDRLTSAGD